MFQRLFKEPGLVRRHYDAPLALERERYLQYLEEIGFKKFTVLKFARALLLAVQKLQTLPSEITTAEIRSAAGQKRKGKLSRRQSQFVYVTTQWCRFMGCLRESDVNQHPFVDLVSDFSNRLEVDQGLSPGTIQIYAQHINVFLRYYWTLDRPISSVSIEDIDNFFRSNGDRWSRRMIAISARALRAFFRHASKQGWCNASIVCGIESPRLYTHENIPMGPAWEDVTRLVTALETDNARDIRDRAMVMLCAIYGLRSSEIIRLRIEDIDWERNQISIWRPKQRNKQIYPLVSSVGNAISRYLREARPSSVQREIFLTLRAPFQPFSTGVIRHAVRKGFETLNIRCPRRGAHALRHSCATHLVQQGLSLKEIGDHLGHRSSSATRVYAKVDLPALREIAVLPFFPFRGAYEA